MVKLVPVNGSTVNEMVEVVSECHWDVTNVESLVPQSGHVDDARVRLPLVRDDAVLTICAFEMDLVARQLTQYMLSFMSVCYCAQELTSIVRE